VHANGHGLRRAVPSAEHVRAFSAVPSQVRDARRFLAAILTGCPVSDDALLCLSELATNCVLHSASRQPGGEFTVRVQVSEGNYVRIELHDNGGPWIQHPNEDDRPHGLAIVRDLAADSGVRGDALTGWISWARLSWHGPPPQRGFCGDGGGI
jgi:anti-sigma regulatory factor (Ser/Thr protein kinase)